MITHVVTTKRNSNLTNVWSYCIQFSLQAVITAVSSYWSISLIITSVLTLPASTPLNLANGFFFFSHILYWHTYSHIFYFNFPVCCNSRFLSLRRSLHNILFIPLQKCCLRVSVSIPALFLQHLARAQPSSTLFPHMVFSVHSLFMYHDNNTITKWHIWRIYALR